MAAVIFQLLNCSERFPAENVNKEPDNLIKEFVFDYNFFFVNGLSSVPLGNNCLYSVFLPAVFNRESAFRAG